MGFSIGRLISDIAAPLGAALLGPIGGILGSGISAGLTSPQGRQTVVAATQAPRVTAGSVVPAPPPIYPQPQATFRSGFAAAPVVRAAGQAAVSFLGGAATQSFFGNGNGQSELSEIWPRTCSGLISGRFALWSFRESADVVEA
jgi:hypothetical protein